MKKVVVDTDVLIDYLRQIEKETFFKSLLSNKKLKVLIAAVSITELWKGESIKKKKEKQKVKDLLERVKVVLAGKQISQKSGELLRKYNHLMLADALVSATAIEKKASLATFNQKHFSLIKEVKLFAF